MPSVTTAFSGPHLGKSPRRAHPVGSCASERQYRGDVARRADQEGDAKEG
jgi:hypothetical protein